MITKFSVHQFNDLKDLKFIASEYSALKFGSNTIAKKYGFEMADELFKKHSDILMSNKCVVIPSPYNYIQNAATIMTKHFVDRINSLLVEANGEHVECSTIHRKVTYTNDYGFLSKEQRKGLIGNDSFYFNSQFIKDKLLIFIDDVRITGSHEEKLIDVMEKDELKNDSMFLYYGNYLGNLPDIESKINLAGISCPEDYLYLVLNDNCQVIVRTTKYLLSLPTEEVGKITQVLSNSFLKKVYYGSLGEGYYKIPAYQQNLNLIKSKIKE